MEALAHLAYVFGLATLLALANERLNERYVIPLLERFGLKQFVPQVSLLLGALLSFLVGLDFITPLLLEGGIVPHSAWAGQITTAIIVGGGSQLLHEIWQHVVGLPGN